MTAIVPGPGIREVILVDGETFGIAVVDMKPTRLESALRCQNGFTRVDRPYLSNATYPLAPDAIVKWQFTIQLDRTDATDIELLTKLRARPGFVDLCLWQFEAEYFSGDATHHPSLWRRPARTFYPIAQPSDAASYDSVATISGTPTSLTIGAADAYGVTAATLGSTAPAGSSNVCIMYVPLYLVRLADDQPKLSGNVTGWHLVLEEI